RPPWRLRLADQGLPVGLRGHGDIAPLAIGDHEQTGALGGGTDLLQRAPAGCPEALEAGQLRLDRHAGGAGGLDQPAAVLEYRRGSAVGNVCEVGIRRRRFRKRGRVRVKPQAYLAAALVDERRESVCEGLGRYPPLTFFFNPEPAEKRGT